MPLNEEQKGIGRRNFLKAIATLPAVGAFTLTATNTGPVKAGIIGTGMEGRILISNMDPKYLYLIASCDIRPDNQKLGQDMIKAAGHSQNPKLYTNLEDMLNDPEIEAVVIATPLKYHGPMAVQALKAGKHVFVEKTMAYTIEDCLEMYRLAEEKKLNLQVGHQRFYNPLYWDAYRMIKEGLLGNIYHVRALWHRNGDWNYWIYVENQFRETLKKFDPSKWGYSDPEHLVNWRWYKDTSHGQWTELCSHQMAITNWIFGDIAPSAVIASGGKYKVEKDNLDSYMRLMPTFQADQALNKTTAKTFDEYRREKMVYSKDDSNIPDHIFAIYEYPNGRTVTYSSIQSNSYDQYYEEIMGTHGTIILSKENESYLFWEPGWDENLAKSVVAEAKGTQVAVTQESLSQSAFAAHVSGEATGGGGASGMTPFEPYKFELQGFAHTIRQQAPNLCNGARAARAALACFKGQEALETQKRVEIQPLKI